MIATIKAINKQLRADTGINVIQANGEGKLPSLPYGTYNLTSPYIKGVGRENTVFSVSGDELQEKRTEQYKSTLSFNLYGTSNETAIDLAMQVREWFLFHGEEFLSDQNVAIVEVRNIENRTTFLVDSYEYKFGFDVQLRMMSELSRNIDYFDHVSVKKGD